jgi:cbb3-type cytochrome oxidase cytochrome c subunit
MVSAAMLGKKMILKKRGKTYFLAQSPCINKNRKPTMAQEKHMNKFSAAVSYAKEVIADPESKNRYRATKNRSKFNNAVRDYMRRPEVREIDASAYND